jgi:spermidine synthase
MLALAALVAASAPARAQENVLHNERSLYRQITVYELAGQRCMRFTRQLDARQSCITISDPDRLVFNSTRMMMGALYLRPDPQSVLIVGLGGGTIARALERVLPQATIDTVEIDPAVVRVARKYFGFESGPRMRVHEEDGRVYVRRAIREGLHYDLVILDAFDQEYIPEHMLTQEFLGEVRQVIAPGGVLAANTYSISKLYDHESTTYESVFGAFYNLRLNNRVILLGRDGLPPMDVVTRNAEKLKAPLVSVGVESSWLLPLFSTTHDWRADARVLTDRYSPANLLNATGTR